MTLKKILSDEELNKDKCILSKKEEEIYYFELETSYKIRKPSLLRNAETGHPPFKALRK